MYFFEWDEKHGLQICFGFDRDDSIVWNLCANFKKCRNLRMTIYPLSLSLLSVRSWLVVRLLIAWPWTLTLALTSFSVLYILWNIARFSLIILIKNWLCGKRIVFVLELWPNMDLLKNKSKIPFLLLKDWSPSWIII